MTTIAKTTVALIAAGQSRRFGAADKLAAPLGDKPLLRWAAEAAFAAPWRERIIVWSAATRAVAEAAAAAFDARLVENKAPEAGLGRSIACAAEAAGDAEALAIALGDMPFTPADLYPRLVAALAPPEKTLAAPFNGARRGHPVIFHRSWFDTLKGFEGDAGAREAIKRAEGRLARVEEPRPGPYFDVDTERDLSRASAILTNQDGLSRPSDSARVSEPGPADF